MEAPNLGPKPKKEATPQAQQPEHQHEAEVEVVPEEIQIPEEEKSFMWRAAHGVLSQKDLEMIEPYLEEEDRIALRVTLEETLRKEVAETNEIPWWGEHLIEGDTSKDRDPIPPKKKRDIRRRKRI